MIVGEVIVGEVIVGKRDPPRLANYFVTSHSKLLHKTWRFNNELPKSIV
jgi:hypothetical protein